MSSEDRQLPLSSDLAAGTNHNDYLQTVFLEGVFNVIGDIVGRRVPVANFWLVSEEATNELTNEVVKSYYVNTSPFAAITSTYSALAEDESVLLFRRTLYTPAQEAGRQRWMEDEENGVIGRYGGLSRALNRMLMWRADLEETAKQYRKTELTLADVKTAVFTAFCCVNPQYFEAYWEAPEDGIGILNIRLTHCEELTQLPWAVREWFRASIELRAKSYIED